MARARGKNEQGEPRRLPRGRSALAPEEVLADQRQRLVGAVPRVVAERGYEAMSVADIVKAAAVSRNAFYGNFGDKRECFAAAHEACHERLLKLLERPCKRRGSTLEERVETALGSGLEMLAAEPEVARLLFVEAPGAGEEIALHYHEWLRRYGRLLQAGAGPAGAGSDPVPEVDQAVVGGIASRVASEVLQGRAARLRLLTPHFVAYVLAFYGPAQPDRQVSAVVGVKPEAAAEPEPRRRQAGK